MIIARVFGGLGNQLFIYAFARQLAVRNKVPLKLDISSGFQRDIYHRSFCLNHFNIHADIATDWECYDCGLGRLRRVMARTMCQYLPIGWRSYIKESGCDFDGRLLNLQCEKRVYLEGYWQSEKYFKDSEDIIREDLEIGSEHSRANLEVAEAIERTTAVCLHVRRYADVFRKRSRKSAVGVQVLGVDYYHKAIDLIARDVDNPIFFCFSDDPEWAKRHLRVGYDVNYVTHNLARGDSKAYEDLWLMSLCKHHIISNSSFGWWGAWLSRNRGKIVYAPNRQFWGSADKIPQTWREL